jgi:hypothetical protein
MDDFAGIFGGASPLTLAHFLNGDFDINELLDDDSEIAHSFSSRDSSNSSLTAQEPPAAVSSNASSGFYL